MNFLTSARTLLRALIFFLQEFGTERGMIGDAEDAGISILQNTVC